GPRVRRRRGRRAGSHRRRHRRRAPASLRRPDSPDPAPEHRPRSAAPTGVVRLSTGHSPCRHRLAQEIPGHAQTLSAAALALSSLTLLPTAARAAEFDTAVTCTSPSSCTPGTTTPAPVGTNVVMTEGGGGPVQVFVVVPQSSDVSF